MNVSSHEDSKTQRKTMFPLSKNEVRIGKIIVNAAFKVRKELGPGLLEKVYEID